MKYLLAFALIAAASALPQPVRLLEPVQLAEPEIAPLMVPQEVMDEVALLVKFVDAPENAEANDYSVHFVEEAVNAETPENAEAGNNDYTVNFVDEAVNVETPAQIQLTDTPLPESVALPLTETVAPTVDANDGNLGVKFVDLVEVEDTLPSMPQANNVVKIVDLPNENAEDFAVKFVDAADIAEAPESIVQSPVDAVQLPESPAEPSDADLAVKFVDVAEMDEETPVFMGKQYSDPMLR